LNTDDSHSGFWNNALFGGFSSNDYYNSSYEPYEHKSFVGFIRGGGTSSYYPGNVFFGIRASDYNVKLHNISPVNSSYWENDNYSSYVSFIRFSGQAKFYSLSIGGSANSTVDDNNPKNPTVFGIRHDGAGYFRTLYIGDLKNSGYLKVSTNGWIYSDTGTSDERLKRNINCINDNLNLLKFYDELVPISYYLRDDTKLSYGFSG